MCGHHFLHIPFLQLANRRDRPRPNHTACVRVYSVSLLARLRWRGARPFSSHRGGGDTDLLCVRMCACALHAARISFEACARASLGVCACACVLCACVNSWQACPRCCVNRNGGILAEVTRWVGGVAGLNEAFSADS